MKDYGRSLRIHPPRRARARALALTSAAAGLVLSGCGTGSGQPLAAGPQTAAAGPTGPASAQPAGAGQPPAGAQPSAGATPSAAGTPQGASGAGARARPLAGKIIGIDPGHNGRNAADPSFINHLIWNGREWETCDTTGTETDSGYPEPLFTWRVARFLRADLRRDGARVVMTRTSNRGAGPCVNRRAQILNRGHASVAIDIHGDGGPASGRGFAVLEPVRDGPNDTVISSSERFGRDVRRAFLRRTSMPESTYDGVHGLTHRDDLAGLNLTRVPKVLIECGNMRNATDARLLTSARFQRRIARALRAAIIRFLTH
jgi:N-acetylmuramoyl-L-alanine amidase